MIGIRIIAKTQKGHYAMLQHVREWKSAPFIKRKAFDQLYTFTVEAHEPYTISVIHRTEHLASLIPAESLAVPVKQTLAEHGAKSGKDYEVLIL